MTNDITPQRIMDLGMGFWASKVVLSAVELGLFTELAKGLSRAASDSTPAPHTTS